MSKQVIQQKWKRHLLICGLISFVGGYLIIVGFYEKYFVNEYFTHNTKLKILTGFLILIYVFLNILAFKCVYEEK